MMDFDSRIPKVGQVVQVKGIGKDDSRYICEAQVLYRFKPETTKAYIAISVPSSMFSYYTSAMNNGDVTKIFFDSGRWFIVDLDKHTNEVMISVVEGE